jgi:hypothetical protein
LSGIARGQLKPLVGGKKQRENVPKKTPEQLRRSSHNCSAATALTKKIQAGTKNSASYLKLKQRWQW